MQGEHTAIIDIDFNAAINGVEAMIFKAARTYLRGWGDAEIQDAAQKCRIHLWLQSIPRFDPDRGTKLSTFLHSCIASFMRDERRTLISQKNSTRNPQPKQYIGGNFARDEFMDRNIEAIAADVLENPRKYLTRRQTKVFRAVTDAPHGTLMKDIGRELGLKNRASLSTRILEIRRRIIKKTDIEAGVL